MTRAWVHPAIVELRRVHAGAFPGVERGSCCASDLVHDERSINTHPEVPFAWAMSPTATYLTRVGTARAATESLTFMSAVIEVERGNPLVLALWDGVALHQYTDAHAWRCAYERESRRLRLAELTAVRATFTREYDAHVFADRIRTLDTEIAELRRVMAYGGEL